MARNSRFRTTSGPSSNRSSSDKRKSKSMRSGPDVSGPGKDFKRPAADRKFSDQKPAPRPFAGKGKPFQKKDWPKKDKSPDTAKDTREFSERQPRSFSKEPKNESFKRNSPLPFGAAKSQVKRGPSDGPGKFAKRRDDSEKQNGPPPREKKSFVESRLDRQRKASVGPKETPAVPDGLIRLNKFISNSGVCSRREADEIIKMGLITVNGKSITEMGYKVKPTDDVRHDGKRLKAEMPVYILLNKPKGFITTTDDPQERNTVMQLISGACKERVYPVGRLDRNTSGLLLLTNDGDLTEKLSHPSYNVKKIYKAELDRPLTKNDFQKILAGVHLEEGKAMVDDLAIVSEDGKTVGLEIHIGWNKVVRRIFESLDYEVVKLDRSVYATLDKKDLPRGNWRFLRQDEVIRLKHFQ